MKKTFHQNIKTEKTTAHVSFDNPPSEETMDAVKKMIDLAYDMPIKKTMEDFFEEHHVSKATITALDGVQCKDDKPGSELFRIKAASEEYAAYQFEQGRKEGWDAGCRKQKIICADEAKAKEDWHRGRYAGSFVDKDSILNAPPATYER